jgi:hypothetical protein
MRKRNNRIWCRLNDQEYHQLQTNVFRTGLSQEAYLRKLIVGIQPKESPPLEYNQLIKSLSSISNNLNQVASMMHSIGIFDNEKYETNYLKLFQEILRIQITFE